MKKNSDRFNINSLFISILLLILLFFSIIPAYITFNLMRDRIENTLLNKAKQIDTYIGEYTLTSLKNPYAANLLYHLFRGEPTSDKETMSQLWEQEIAPLGLKSDFYRIRNFKWQVVLRSKNLTALKESYFDKLFSNNRNETEFAYMKINGKSYYGINCPVTFSHFNYLNLQLAVPIPFAQSILENVILSYICGIVIILLLCAYYFFGTKRNSKK